MTMAPDAQVADADGVLLQRVSTRILEWAVVGRPATSMASSGFGEDHVQRASCAAGFKFGLYRSAKTRPSQRPRVEPDEGVESGLQLFDTLQQRSHEFSRGREYGQRTASAMAVADSQ